MFVGGYTVFTLSECPSVHPSVRPTDRVSVTFCFLNILKKYQWNFVKFCIPPANCVCGRVYCFHVVRMSVRPSVRPSDRPCVCNVLFLNILKNYQWNFIKFCKHIYIYKANTTNKKLWARGQYYWSYFPL